MKLSDGDVIYRASPGGRASSSVLALLCIPLLIATATRHDNLTLGGILIYYAIFGGVGVFALLLGRGWIRVSDDGISARNLVTSIWVPWHEVETLVAESKVGIVQRNGETWWCWAVQRANITKMLNRRSRVDRVIEEIELRRTKAVSVGTAPGDRAWRSLVRPAWWELVIIAAYVAIAISGLVAA